MPPNWHAKFVVILLLAILAGGCATTPYDTPIDCNACAAWNEAQAPFQVFGNTWYVGTRGLSALLIDTGEGLILIDGALPQSAPLIDGNIRALGFQTEDIRLILVSHVHFDHVGGIAALQRLSGADVLTSDRGLRPLVRGRLDDDDPQYDLSVSESRFPAVANVQAVGDRQVIELGTTRIVAHYTPGHTPGGMSYVWQSCDESQCLATVYADSLTPVSAEGFYFSDGDESAAEKLVESTRRIAELDCDIFLSNHPFRFNMVSKLEQQDADRFVNADGCRNYALRSLAQLEKRMLQEASQ